MSQVAEIMPKSRFANTRSLENLNFSRFQLAGTGNLSPLARRWLFFFVSVVRMGYVGIKAPIGAVVKAQYRAQGQTSSERTAYRGLKALEQAGYITRQKYRVGPDRFETIIHVNLDKFSFWLRERPHIRAVTPAYINSQLSSCQEGAVTSEESLVNTLNSYPKGVNKHPRATISKGEHFKNNTEEGRREHPIVYSIRRATEGQGKKRRGPMIELARLEAENPNKRASDAPWDKWTKVQKSGRLAFEELGIPHERESVAREQFLPYLESMLGLEKIHEPIKALFRRGPKPIEKAEPAKIIDEPSPQEVKQMLKESGLEGRLGKIEPDEEEVTPPSAEEFKDMLREAGLDKVLRIPPGDAHEEPEKPNLSDSDLEILKAAKSRATKEAGSR